MKPEDFPLEFFQGRRLRTVPELPGISHETWARCTMCLACPDGVRNKDLCDRIRQRVGGCEVNKESAIHIPEEDFQEYVVELVRRRVSS